MGTLVPPAPNLSIQRTSQGLRLRTASHVKRLAIRGQVLLNYPLPESQRTSNDEP